MNALRRPEILAPAANDAMLAAAIENGADAVYFGLQDFNARLRADNFAAADLPRIMATLHERGLRGYVTLNTLVFPSELPAFAAVLAACARAGVDAILVQDLGAAWLANRLAPELSVHASTQMTVTAAESIAGLERLGLHLDRIVLARELSRRDIARMRPDTDHELEVFVHGALCVAYSGQCLTSEALGGRSANRGECAQACRLPYDLVVDGRDHDTDGRRYPLSPKDLAAWQDVGELLDLGIASFKIEGRLKSPEYVAATVRSYREAVERAAAGQPLVLDDATRERLEMTFSRGFTGGYLHAVDHQVVVDGRFPKKRGLRLGTVVAADRRGVTIDATGPLKRGDGVVFDAGRPDLDEEGGRIHTIDGKGQSLAAWRPTADQPTARLFLRFGDGCIDSRRIAPGNLVWKTSDPAIDEELRASFASGRIHHRRPVQARVEGRVGAPLRLTLEDGTGVVATVEDTEPAAEALRHPLEEATLREQLGRLGNTPFELAALDVRLEGRVIVPKSRLNELRRRAVEELLARRARLGTDRRVEEAALDVLLAPVPADETPPPVAASRLSVLCRSLEQVEAAAAFGDVETIYTDFEDVRLHREARRLVPEGAIRFVPATLRVVKPGESGFVRRLLDVAPDAILVRNMAAWTILHEAAAHLPLVADYPFNVANHLAARLLHEARFAPLTPSYDLNIDQLLDLLRAAPPQWFEVTIHQRMPLFHMEHCVFCRYLSDGTDHTNCGRPCEDHDVRLRDRVGYEHPLKADAGCRNTVFNAVAQSGSAYLPAMLRAGVRRFRVDLLTETAAETQRVLASYLPAIRGERDGTGLWRELRASSKLGVTRGSLDHD